MRRLFTSPEKGAKTTLYLAKHEAAGLPSGKYYVKSEEAKADKQVYERRPAYEALELVLRVPWPPDRAYLSSVDRRVG